MKTFHQRYYELYNQFVAAGYDILDAGMLLIPASEGRGIRSMFAYELCTLQSSSVMF